MRTLDTEAIYQNLKTRGLHIHPGFLNETSVDVPMMEQVRVLLDAVGEKGVKLTPKGNLPTKVVEAITRCRPTLSEGQYLELHKRFLEPEHVPASRARVLCEIGKLVRVKKQMLVPGTMAKAYRDASAAERYLYLLETSLNINFAYFDNMQSYDALNTFSVIVLQLMRDREALYRDSAVYAALLYDAVPAIAEHVETEVKSEGIFLQDPFDVFEWMLDIRLFRRFFAPFGLCDEEQTDEVHDFRYRKTDLLERLLLPLNAVNTDLVLNKKRFRSFAKRIRDEQLDIDLLHDFCYLFAGFAQPGLPSPQMMTDEIVEQKRLTGAAAEGYAAFYQDFAMAIFQTLRQFTQLEAKGAREDLKDDFESLIEGIYQLMPKTTPHNLFAAMQIMPFFLFDLLQKAYDIDITSSDFFEQCKSRFDDEVAEDIGGFIYLMEALQKKSKKAKRITAQMVQAAYEAIMGYLMAVMSVYVHALEQG